jgi:hypothetical protein
MITFMVVQVSRILMTKIDLSLAALGSDRVHYCLKNERQELELRVLVFCDLSKMSGIFDIAFFQWQTGIHIVTNSGVLLFIILYKIYDKALGAQLSNIHLVTAVVDCILTGSYSYCFFSI